MLKEAGFDVPCRGVYVTDRTGYYEFREYDNKQTADDLCWNTEDGFQYEYLAPTQALAARWLREVHHYAVCVWYSAEHEKWFYAHGNLDNMMFDEEYSISDFIYDSYEQALEAGLKRGLELAKK
jgi:hypothetical protein